MIPANSLHARIVESVRLLVFHLGCSQGPDLGNVLNPWPFSLPHLEGSLLLFQGKKMFLHLHFLILKPVSSMPVIPL